MKVYFYSVSVCVLLIVCLWLLMLCLQILHTDTFVAPQAVQHGTRTAVYRRLLAVSSEHGVYDVWAGTPAEAGPAGWVATDADCLLALQ